MMRRLRAPDDGFTLVEIVVATSIMAACMAMFTAGIIQIYRFVNKTETAADAQGQLAIAFQRLDKELRYASGISTPGLVGDNPYVEYLTTGTGTAVCSQLRLNVTTGVLQYRSWDQGSSPLAPSGWATLAAGVSSAQPFTVTPAGSTFNFQRLTLSLVVSSGGGGTATTTQTEVTFTALNTSLATSSATVCTEGRSVP